MAQAHWWVFDRPLPRDPLFLAGLALGSARLAVAVAGRAEHGAPAFLIMAATAVPSGLLLVGIVAGSVREFVRGRASSRR